MINRFPFARTALTAFLAVGLLSACSSTDESDDPAAAATPVTETISVSGVPLYDYQYATCKDNVTIIISFDADGGGTYNSSPTNDAQCTDPVQDPTQTTYLTLSNVQVVTDNTSTTYAIDPFGEISTAQQEHTLITFDASAMTGTASAPCTSCQVYAYAVDDVLGSGLKALALTDLKATASPSDNSTYFIQGQ